MAQELPPPPPLEIVCINLDRRPDRWTETQAAFAPTGLVLQRMSAYDAPRGVDGCRASHMAVIRQAKDRGLPWIGIMEDDCEPYACFAEEFPTALAVAWSARTEWDMFNTGPIDIHQNLARVKENLIAVPRCICLQLYVVQESVYDRILAWDPAVHRPEIDEYYSTFARTVTWAPMLTHQRPSPSDIRDASKIVTTADQFAISRDALEMFAKKAMTCR